MWFTEDQGQRIGRAVILLSQVDNLTSSTPDGTYPTGPINLRFR